MGICNTAYDTSIGVSINTKPIINNLKESFIKDMIYEKNLGYDISPNYKLCFVDGSDSSEEFIPQIVHPIVVRDNSNKGENNFICSDIRLFVTSKQFEADGISPKVRNYSEYNLMVDRALLQLLWLDGNVTNLQNNFEFAGVVFANWLTEVIARRFALNGRDQLMLTVLAFIYYQSLFYDENDQSDDIIEYSYIKLINQLRIPREIIDFVVSRELRFTDIHSFIKTVSEVLENVRLREFNFGLLVTLISNSWFGVNADRMLAVCLEHPPTWIALIGNAMSYKGMKSMTIMKVIDKVAKRGAGDVFVNSYKNTLSFKR